MTSNKKSKKWVEAYEAVPFVAKQVLQAMGKEDVTEQQMVNLAEWSKDNHLVQWSTVDVHMCANRKRKALTIEQARSLLKVLDEEEDQYEYSANALMAFLVEKSKVAINLPGHVDTQLYWYVYVNQYGDLIGRGKNQKDILLT